MKLPFWATLLTLLGICTLCALGTWQIQRMQWKNDLLEKLDAASKTDPSEITLNPSNFTENDPDIIRGTLDGTYLHEKSIRLAPRVLNGRIGYYLVTPLALPEDGGYVLVQRGWVLQDAPDYDISRPSGKIRITGIVRRAPQDSLFVPSNDPEKDIWYRLKPQEIAKAKDLHPVYPRIFIAETENANMNRSSYPVPVAAITRPNNNHAQYALFWFTMAAALAAIYVLRFIYGKRVGDCG